MSESLAIGIDLGTTNSCVAIYHKGRAEIIANDVGERTTPSYVAFKDEETLVGEIAKNQAQKNYENTIYDAKRLIGKRFNDPTVQVDMKNWPFRVVNEHGKPKVQVKYRNEEVRYCPKEISSKILGKLRDAASKYVGAPITKAVITVPAYFNDAQRQATKEAGKLAGLEVLRLLNEPTAAAIAYALDKDAEEPRYAMIFDLGGGTFDVSIIKFENRRVAVKAIDGDTHLGGNDFDNRLLDHFAEQIKENYNHDVKKDRRRLARLRAACEKAKRELSFLPLARLELDYFIGENDYEAEILKATFENLNEDLFQKALTTVKNCVEQAELRPNEIHDVVLVGGSTRIPRIRELLEVFFNGKILSHSVHPDEAVALGAAIQAANLNEHETQAVKDFDLKDVVPLSLGVETAGGLMSVLIKRNTPLPAIAAKSFTTAKINQSSVNIKIFEGERPLTKNNNLLGELKVTGILPAAAGVPRIDEKFYVDENGILSVTAIERSTGKTLNLYLDVDKDRLSSDEIERILKDAEISRKHDEMHWRTIEVRNELESYCNNTLRLMQDVAMTAQHRILIIRKCNEILAHMASSKNEDEEELTEKLTNLKLYCDPIVDLYKDK